MISSELVAVTSRSFSKNSKLCELLRARFSNVKFNEKGEKLTGDALIDFLNGAKRAIIGLEMINDELLQRIPTLKAICKMGTGIDKIDFTAIEKHNIQFTHTPAVNKRSVSELVLALIFTLIRKLPLVNNLIQQKQWQQPTGNLLSNKTIGIIGFGAIGQDLAKLLSVFDCKCVVYDVRQYENLPVHVSQVRLEELLKIADIITLHIPFNPENRYFLDVYEFSQMKQNAILINTARGGLINEETLYDALTKGHLAAAAMDVFENEPHIPEKLLKLENFYATSHIAGSTEEAIEAMGLLAIENLAKIKIS